MIEPSAISAAPDLLAPPPPVVAADSSARGTSTARQLAALLAFGRRASARPGAEVLCQDALSLALTVLGGTLGSLVETTADGQTLNVRLFQPQTTGPALLVQSCDVTREPAASLAGFAVAAAIPLVIDHRRERRFADAALSDQGIAFSVSCPVPAGDCALRAIAVHRAGGGDFSADEAQFLETLAHMLAASVALVRATAPRGTTVPRGPGMEASAGVEDDEQRLRWQRSSPRVPYLYNQWIAPRNPNCPLTLDSFFEVLCRDISGSGISFYLPVPPEFSEVVVGLGRKPDLALFAARVARVVEEFAPGGKRYLVGCSFTGRLQMPAVEATPSGAD